MFNKALILTFSIVVNICHGWIDIGKYLKTCDRNSLEVNDCLLNAIRDGVAIMTDGIPDLDVPPIDPYHQKELRVEYNNFQFALAEFVIKNNMYFRNDATNIIARKIKVSAKMIMTNIYVVGMKDAKVKKARLRADEDNFHLEVDLFSPRISINGSYNGYGAISNIKINASGEFNCTMHELDYTWKIDGKPEQKDNVTYMKVENFYMRPNVGRMKSFLTTDDPTKQDFIDFANNFSNNNWKPLYKELLPYAQANWNLIGIRVANKIFLKIPYNQLFSAN